MAWETRNGRGSYYTRSRRYGKRIVREYYGCGEAAALIAMEDVLERQTRQAEAARRREQAAEDQRLDAEIETFCRLADTLAHALLVSAGYHNHKGQWRKRREKAEV